jgi:membrane protein DedA with SNARE-associated domain
MRWRRFLVANAAGGIIWSGVYTWGAYELGSSIKKVNGTIDYVLIAVAVAVIAVVVVLVRRKTAQLEAVAEARYPGALEAR